MFRRQNLSSMCRIIMSKHGPRTERVNKREVVMVLIQCEVLVRTSDILIGSDCRVQRVLLTMNQDKVLVNNV